MKQEYKPETDNQKLGYFIEECGEALAAVGKAQRWGLNSVNPELPEDEQEDNRAWIRRELRDLTRAIRYVREVLDA